MSGCLIGNVRLEVGTAYLMIDNSILYLDSISRFTGRISMYNDSEMKIITYDATDFEDQVINKYEEPPIGYRFINRVSKNRKDFFNTNDKKFVNGGWRSVTVTDTYEKNILYVKMIEDEWVDVSSQNFKKYIGKMCRAEIYSEWYDGCKLVGLCNGNLVVRCDHPVYNSNRQPYLEAACVMAHTPKRRK